MTIAAENVGKATRLFRLTLYGCLKRSENKELAALFEERMKEKKWRVCKNNSIKWKSGETFY